MERMEEAQLVKRIVGSDVRSVRLRGKPKTRWMDSVKRALNEGGMGVEQGRILVCGKREWRAVVNAKSCSLDNPWRKFLHI